MRDRYYNKAVNDARVALRRRHDNVYKKLIHAEYIARREEHDQLEEEGNREELKKIRAMHRTNATLQLSQMFADEFAELLHSFKHWYGVRHVHEAAEHNHRRLQMDEDSRPKRGGHNGYTNPA